MKSTKRAIQKAKLSFSKMASDVKDPAAIVGGMVVGKVLGDFLDEAITKGTAVAGLKGFDSVTSFIKPVLLIGGGLAAKQLVKNPLLKNVGIGMAAYGAATAIQGVVNIPQLSSFNNPPATTTAPVAGLGIVPRRTIGALPPRPVFPVRPPALPAQTRNIL